MEPCQAMSSLTFQPQHPPFIIHSPRTRRYFLASPSQCRPDCAVRSKGACCALWTATASSTVHLARPGGGQSQRELLPTTPALANSPRCADQHDRWRHLQQFPFVHSILRLSLLRERLCRRGSRSCTMRCAVSRMQRSSKSVSLGCSLLCEGWSLKLL